jgi:hypothetical protein
VFDFGRWDRQLVPHTIVYKNNCRPESSMNCFVTGKKKKKRGARTVRFFGITRNAPFRFGQKCAQLRNLTLKSSS